MLSLMLAAPAFYDVPRSYHHYAPHAILTNHLLPRHMPEHLASFDAEIARLSAIRERMYDDWHKMQSRGCERYKGLCASAERFEARERSHTHAYEKVLKEVRRRREQAEQEMRHRRVHNERAEHRRRELKERSHEYQHGSHHGGHHEHRHEGRHEGRRERRHERRELPVESSADLRNGERRATHHMSECSCVQVVRKPLATNEALAQTIKAQTTKAVAKEPVKEAAEEAEVARRETMYERVDAETEEAAARREMLHKQLRDEDEATAAKAAATVAAKAKVEAAANKAAKAMEAAKRAVNEAARAAQEAGEVELAFEVIDVVEAEEAGSPDTEPEYDEPYPSETLTGRGAREASGYTAAARRHAAAARRSHGA